MVGRSKETNSDVDVSDTGETHPMWAFLVDVP
jgi:hypothetical protein